MAQTNFTPILTYKSDTATVVPSAGNLTNSENGAELAVNTADKRLFTKDSGGNVVELGTNPSSLTLPNSTANGVVYANGSKVLTSGSALTFDGAALRVASSIGTGGAVFTNNEGGIWMNGYASYGSGLFSDATGQQIRFQSGGSEQMRLTGTGLGIGTSSPSTKIEVRGAGATVAGISGVVGGIFENSANATTAPQGALTLGAAYTGTTPTVYAYVAGAKENAADGNFAGALIFGSRPNGGNLTERMRLNSSGNLGLGVTPSAWGLSGSGYRAVEVGALGNGVFAGPNDVNFSSNAYYSAGWKYGATGFASQYNQNSGQHAWFTAPSGTAGNAISFTQAMTLNANGNFSLGTTSPTELGGYISQTINGSSGSFTEWRQNNSNTFRVGSDSSDGGFLFTQGAVAIRFGTNTTERARIDSSGNVGIGTSSPTNKLEVASSTTNTGITIYNNNGSGGLNARLGFKSLNGYDASSVLAAVTAVPNSSGNTATSLVFSTSGNNSIASAGLTERMTLDSSGNLGLGVTPSAWGGSLSNVIQLKGGGNLGGHSATNSVYVGNNYYYDGSNYRYIASATASQYQQFEGKHLFFTAPSGTAGNAISFTQAMTLDASGNLALGGTTANGRMTVYGNIFDLRNTSGGYGTGYALEFATNATIPRIDFVDNGVYTGNLKSSGGVVTLSNSSNNALAFSTNGSERARIDSSGNLLSGCTSLPSASVKGNAFLNDANQGRLYVAADNTGARDLAYWINPNGVVGTITTSGTTTSYNTSSDYRLKNITGPITTSGAYIDSLNPVEGTWKADGSTFVGLIAHEVQEASRTQVATGEKDGEQMQGMDYSNAELIANMLAELKSLRQRLAAAGI